jgi:hypothetical protein
MKRGRRLDGSSGSGGRIELSEVDVSYFLVSKESGIEYMRLQERAS